MIGIWLNIDAIPFCPLPYQTRIPKNRLTFSLFISILVEMKTREKSVMDEILKILKALSDKNRLRIVKILQQRSLCVCEITSILELATSTVSSHLSILKDAEIIMDQKDGKWVDYRLNTQSKNPYLIGLLPLIAFWLNDDPRVKSDLQKLKTTDRVELCKT